MRHYVWDRPEVSSTINLINTATKSRDTTLLVAVVNIIVHAVLVHSFWVHETGGGLEARSPHQARWGCGDRCNKVDSPDLPVQTLPGLVHKQQHERPFF